MSYVCGLPLELPDAYIEYAFMEGECAHWPFISSSHRMGRKFIAFYMFEAPTDLFGGKVDL
jgi:hypothetical protein